MWLTITGTNLDAGRSLQIQIIDNPTPLDAYSFDPLTPMAAEDYARSVSSQPQRIVKCDIKNVTNKELKCRLNDKFRSLGKKDVRLVLDENMSIVRYASLRVTSDPLVKSIDKQVSFYAGGTQFRLHGFNFDAVQSAYTYAVYKAGVWYSEPLQARARLSNELILFEFPALPDAFFQQLATASIDNNKIQTKVLKFNTF